MVWTVHHLQNSDETMTVRQPKFQAMPLVIFHMLQPSLVGLHAQKKLVQVEDVVFNKVLCETLKSFSAADGFFFFFFFFFRCPEDTKKIVYQSCDELQRCGALMVRF